jgi:sigma-B regulation protein RsbU (phosphoserine phosphatase)
MDDGSYPSEEVTLEVGDVALLYTDGISEAQNRALEQFGTERLMQVLRESPVDETATALIERILSTFHTFRGGRLLKDDITIVALRRVG